MNVDVTMVPVVAPGGLNKDGTVNIGIIFKPEISGTGGTLQRNAPGLQRWPSLISNAIHANVFPKIGVGVQWRDAQGQTIGDPIALTGTFNFDQQLWNTLTSQTIQIDAQALEARAYAAQMAAPTALRPNVNDLAAYLKQHVHGGRQGSRAQRFDAVHPILKAEQKLRSLLGEIAGSVKARGVADVHESRPPEGDPHFQDFFAHIMQLTALAQRCGFVLRGSLSKPPNGAVLAQAHVVLADSPAGLHVLADSPYTWYDVTTGYAGSDAAASPVYVKGGVVDKDALKIKFDQLEGGKDILSAAAVVRDAASRNPSEQALATSTSGVSGRTLTLYGDNIPDFAGATQNQQRAMLRSVAAARSGLKPFAEPVMRFSADSLTRGFAVDIIDDGEITLDYPAQVRKPTPGNPNPVTDWRSTCGRVVTLKDRDDDVVFEFHQEAPLGVNTTSSKDIGISVHDVILRYANRSPVASTGTRDPDAWANDQMSIRAEMTPAGPLPQMLYGHRFRGRMRPIDATGGGPTLKDGATAQSSEPVDFGRYEPVAAPDLIVGPGDLRFPGDRADVLVIRSEAGKALRPSVVTRTLTIPLVPYDMAKMHGALRRAEEANLKAYLSDKPADEEPPFPDPMCLGVAIRLQGPGDTREPNMVDPIFLKFPTKKWPLVEKLTIRFEPAADSGTDLWTTSPKASDPVTDATTLTVKLKPGVIVRASIVTVVDTERLHHHALLTARHYDDVVTQKTMIDSVKASLDCIVTPARHITFEYATRQPTFAPILQNSDVGRAYNDPASAVQLYCSYPGISTESVQILSEWPAWRIAENGIPTRYRESRVVGTWPPSPDLAPALDTKPIRLPDGSLPTQVVAFNDVLSTQRRDVRYRLIARSRFVSMFENAPAQTFTVTSLAAGPDDLDKPQVTQLPNTVVPPPLAAYAIVTSFKWTKSGKTTIREPGKIRIYLNGDWYVTGDGEEFAVITSNGAIDPSAVTANDTPGVVSWIGSDPAFVPNVQPIMDVKATDVVPARPGWSLRDYLTDGLDDFPRPVLKDTYTTWDTEGRKQTGTAAIEFKRYVPRWDKEDKRWFVDMTIIDAHTKDTPSYMPFVHIAAARYQSGSLPDRHFSRIASFTTFQVLPRRELDFAVVPNNGGYDITATVSSVQTAAAKSVLNVYLDRVRFPRGNNNYEDESEMVWMSDADSNFSEPNPGKAGVRTFVKTVTFKPIGFRIRVEEQEVYASDNLDDPTKPTQATRIVYLDTTGDLKEYV